jgi:hypothetical protein
MDSLHRRGGDSYMAGHLDVKVIRYQRFVVSVAPGFLVLVCSNRAVHARFARTASTCASLTSGIPREMLNDHSFDIKRGFSGVNRKCASQIDPNGMAGTVTERLASY